MPLATALAALATLASPAICDIGRAVLRDLPALTPKGADGTTFHVGESATSPDLLRTCPALRSALPAGYTLADADARKRASAHVPQPGVPTTPAYIFYFALPSIDADGKGALVKVTTDCTGLCGASFEMRYIRTRDGWRRDGEVHILSVS